MRYAGVSKANERTTCSVLHHFYAFRMAIFLWTSEYPLHVGHECIGRCSEVPQLHFVHYLYLLLVLALSLSVYQLLSRCYWLRPCDNSACVSYRRISSIGAHSSTCLTRQGSPSTCAFPVFELPAVLCFNPPVYPLLPTSLRYFRCPFRGLKRDSPSPAYKLNDFRISLVLACRESTEGAW